MKGSAPRDWSGAQDGRLEFSCGPRSHTRCRASTDPIHADHAQDITQESGQLASPQRD